MGDDLASVAYLFGQQAPEYKVDETLKEGMVLDIGKWKLEVMETPGHSLGSLCLYERNEKVLFSGDTVFPDGNIGRTDMYGGDTSELVRSIERLTRLGCEDHVSRPHGNHKPGCQPPDSNEPPICQQYAVMKTDSNGTGIIS